MKNKMLQRIGAAVAGLVIVLVFGFWLHSRQPKSDVRQAPPIINRNSQPRSDQEDDALTGASQAEMGLMTKGDGTRWNQMMRTVKQRGSITPSELDWALQGLARPYPNLSPTLAATRRLEFMLLLREAKDYTPAQEERIYQATEGYLSSPEANDKLGALAIMRTLKDGRAIPKVKPLLDDQNKLVRSSARKTLAVVPQTG